MKFSTVSAMIVASVMYASGAQNDVKGIPPLPHQPDACCAPSAKNHPMVFGNFGNTMYSVLESIKKQNVDRLGGAWLLRVDGGIVSTDQQSTPVVIDGVMYVQSASQKVLAIDAKTGMIKWQYAAGGSSSKQRGVAVGEKKVFASLEGRRVIALDQATGALLWQTVVGCNTAALNCEFPGGSTPAAVVYHDGLIYVGGGLGDAGVRGRGYALRASDGRVAWTFWGPAEPGTVGGDTWEGTSWRTGGAAPWMHPAVDPELGLVYWTFGNPFPSTDGSTRGGDNLFANSIVAMDARTGTYKWHFQMVRHDLWDSDNVMAPVLMDLRIDGRLRKAVVVAGKTGYLYILDRISGAPLQGVEYTPVPQEPRQKTAGTQPIPAGDAFVPLCPVPGSARLSERPVQHYTFGCIFTPFWDRPVLAAPGTAGGAVWSALSFNPTTGLLYFGAMVTNGAFTNGRDGRTRFGRPLGVYRSGKIVAMDPRTNTIAWEKHTSWGGAHGHGILTTAGNVMFIGQPDGYLIAMDIDNGRELWRFQTGAGVHTAPITYEVDGEQYIAVLAGGSTTTVNSPKGDYLWAFKIGGTLAEAAAPPPPSVRQPINAAAVAGSTVNNTVLLGRLSGPDRESTISENAMLPQHLVVPAGTTVTFTNPASNTNNHCATSFFETEFDSGVLSPGQSFTHTFAQPGEYFYNNCVWPQMIGKVVVK